MAVDDRTTAIVGARVIDGLGREPIEKGTVVIEDDSVTAVGKDTAVQIPRGANVLDAAGSDLKSSPFHRWPPTQAELGGKLLCD